MTSLDWKTGYLCLHPKAALKHLETPFIYHIGRDELYEIDDTAFEFLRQCNGIQAGGSLTSDAEFVEYCIEEDLLEVKSEPQSMEVRSGKQHIPSLRYLELHLTHACNLNCAHCYLEPGGAGEMAIEDAVRITREFSDIGGLRLLISGGEPLMYPHLEDYLDQTADVKVRRVLFTNGTRIDSNNVARLADVDEIQFSLDGWESGHNRLRGKGAFSRTMRGIEIVRAAGIAISFSTMIHRHNLDEFDRMADFIREADAVEWGIDVMTVAGSLSQHMGLTVGYEQAVAFMEYGFGGGYHGASEGYACGRHLMAVMPDGRAVKCGFYMDKPLGDARYGLADCWRKMEHIPLSDLECGDCDAIDECRGGCRYRAPHPLAPDPAMCCLYGISR